MREDGSEASAAQGEGGDGGEGWGRRGGVWDGSVACMAMVALLVNFKFATSSRVTSMVSICVDIFVTQTTSTSNLIARLVSHCIHRIVQKRHNQTTQCRPRSWPNPVTLSHAFVHMATPRFNPKLHRRTTSGAQNTARAWQQAHTTYLRRTRHSR